MSPGIRSGVNCTRLVSTSSAVASVRTSSVLATPGTPSISTWPPESSATSSPETAASWPTTALATSARTAESASRCLAGAVRGLVRGSRSSGAHLVLECGEPAAEIGQGGVVGDGGGREQVVHRRGSRPVRAATACTTTADGRVGAAARSVLGEPALRGRAAGSSAACVRSRRGGRAGPGSRVDSTARTTTGSGSVTSGPSRRPRQSSSASGRGSSSHSAGTSQRRQQRGDRDAVAGGDVGRRRRRTRPAGRAGRAAAAPARRCRPRSRGRC